MGFPFESKQIKNLTFFQFFIIQSPHIIILKFEKFFVILKKNLKAKFFSDRL